MKWITRLVVHVDCAACPGVIKRLVDNQAEFLSVPARAVGGMCYNRDTSQD
jgi:hypothetical protein